MMSVSGKRFEPEQITFFNTKVGAELPAACESGFVWASEAESSRDTAMALTRFLANADIVNAF
jgi:hypothetical protein